MCLVCHSLRGRQRLPAEEVRAAGGCGVGLFRPGTGVSWLLRDCAACSQSLCDASKTRLGVGQTTVLEILIVGVQVAVPALALWAD